MRPSREMNTIAGHSRDGRGRACRQQYDGKPDRQSERASAEPRPRPHGLI